MKVLIADDDPVLRHLLESTLKRWGYDVIVVKDGLEAEHMLLSDDAPQIAILDWWMPGVDGIDLCRRIRQSKPEPYIYIVLLSSKCTPDDVILGLEAGADDYVTKPFNPAELQVRLQTGERIIDLQVQLINSREALREQAKFDHLTNLLNRGAILDILNDELARSQREGRSLAITLADVDNFKQINDRHGHAIGDRVLCSIAEVLLETTRCYDSVGRYGGEEFLIVMPGCDRSDSLTHANRLRKAASHLFVELPTGNIRTTVSLGVTVAEPGTSMKVSELVNAADRALYEAKHLGRNRVEFSESIGNV